jgi:hypothetical protein
VWSATSANTSTRACSSADNVEIGSGAHPWSRTTRTLLCCFGAFFLTCFTEEASLAIIYEKLQMFHTEHSVALLRDIPDEQNTLKE